MPPACLASGVLSDAASFSFFTNKNMTTAEGGMMIVRDAQRRQRARALRAHGMTASTLDRAKGRAVGYDVIDCGHNFRMDELRAAIGLVQIERLLGWNERAARWRRTIAGRWRASLPRLSVPFADDHATSAHIMPVLLPAGSDRQSVMQRMREQNIQTSMHYPPIHTFSHYRKAFPTAPLPQTELFCERELTLPLHPQLSLEDVDRVVAALRDSLRA